MLARLIHLDLRFAYKRFLAMAAVLLLLGLLAPYMSDEGLLGLGLTVVFTATMTAVPAFCVALVVQHFRRNLFSNEGYLMFTLPVSATKLLLSKVITTLIWFNLMLAAALGLFALLNREQIPAGFFGGAEQHPELGAGKDRFASAARHQPYTAAGGSGDFHGHHTIPDVSPQREARQCSGNRSSGAGHR
ncbi:MAG: hypothetical protein ACOX18_04380 [Bacillota bacterium]|jgi:hypothetical protein